ncbi:MAG: hypothetical protein IJJ33_14790 [Victivallales bacterium]|nr:hypothetical protein [Victivallales bacterium]
MDKNTNDSLCPSPEELQEYRDLPAQMQASHPLASHIANCQECQRHMQAYALMDKALGRMMTPTEGLSGRILAAVHTPELPQQNTSSPSSWWQRLAWGGIAAAACLAITMGVWARRSVPNGNKVQVAANTPKTAASPAETMTQAAPAASQNSIVLDRQTAQREPDLPKQTTPTQSVTRVATHRDSTEGRRVPVMDVQQTLPAQVRHVWVVPNLGREMAYFGKRLGVKVEAAPGSVTVRIPDQELQELVNDLRKRRWALLSPTLPQPGQAEALRLTGRPVEYTLDIQPQEE